MLAKSLLPAPIHDSDVTRHVSTHATISADTPADGKLSTGLTAFFSDIGLQQTLLGIISLQTGTELISLSLVFNKVTGFYGLLAILTGYELSLLQLSTYVYSIAVLAALIYLVPHIRKQDAFECLALGWMYTIDTIINAACTLLFGLDWYFATQSSDDSDAQPSSLNGLISEGLDGLRKESMVHGKVVPKETATSMTLIVLLMLLRVCFSLVVMAYARQALQKYMMAMALMVPEGAEESTGPFEEGMPEGSGRRGRLGRLMVSYGRGYWFQESQLGWTGHGQRQSRKSSSATLAGEV